MVKYRREATALSSSFSRYLISKNKRGYLGEKDKNIIWSVRAILVRLLSMHRDHFSVDMPFCRCGKSTRIYSTYILEYYIGLRLFSI